MVAVPSKFTLSSRDSMPVKKIRCSIRNSVKSLVLVFLGLKQDVAKTYNLFSGTMTELEADQLLNLLYAA